MFQVINSLTKEPVERTFDDPKAAGQYATQMTNATGFKHVVKPIKATKAPVDDSWKAREKKRFLTGEYLHLRDGLRVLVEAKYPDHFAHVSKVNPEAIAFTPDAVMGAADRQRRRTVRGYLEDFFTDLNNDQIEELIAEHEEHFLTLDLKFATDPDEITEVYMNFEEGTSGVSESCMRHGYRGHETDTGDSFSTTKHPTSVYASPDLALAYMTNDDGETVARALVWPEKKLYTRIYGSGSRLATALKRKGYRASAGYYGAHDCDTSGNKERLTFEGARLALILEPYQQRRYGNEHQAVLMPFLDEIGRVGLHPTDPKYLVFARNGFFAQATTGFVVIETPVGCKCCSTMTYESSSAPIITEMNSRGRAVSTGRVCNNCTEAHDSDNTTRMYFCNGNASWVLTETGGAPVLVDGFLYTPGWVEANMQRCARTNELCHKGHLLEVIVSIEPRVTEMWSRNAVRYHAAFDRDTFYDSYTNSGITYDRALMDPESMSEDHHCYEYINRVRTRGGRLATTVAAEREARNARRREQRRAKKTKNIPTLNYIYTGEIDLANTVTLDQILRNNAS